MTNKSKYYPVKGSDWFALKNVLKSDENRPWEDVWGESDEIRLLREQGGVFVNDAFMNLWNVTSGLMFLDGGYGSSKTTYIITRLLIKAKENPYFRCYYGRQTKVDARKLHSNIITEIKRNGWQSEFKYSENPTASLEIHHIETGNKFIGFGCEDHEILKGLDNPTDILVDEINQISFESFGMLFTRLRGNTSVDLQMVGCFNNCDVFPDHWLRKFIYIEKSKIKASSEAEEILLKALLEINILKHHSIYTDNWFQNNEAYYRKLIVKANGDKEKIRAYCNGEWGVRLKSQPYYKMFSKQRQLAWVEYDPNLDLHFSFDENVNPYLPVIISQINGSEVRIIDEIAARNPNNTLEWICGELTNKYAGHKGKVYIYGDATSKKEDVKLEKGTNFFTFTLKYLSSFDVELRTASSNPNNKSRQGFVNAIFSFVIRDCRILINPGCVHLIEDLVNTIENPAKKQNGELVGGKDKHTETVDGVRGVQRYGHFGDCLDYLVCEARMDAYILYQTNGYIYDVVGGYRTVNNGISEDYSPNKRDDEEEEEEEPISYKRVSRNGY